MISFSNVPEKLNLDWILNKVSEEEVFSFYGITVQKKIFCSPLREDKRPTCSFYRTEKGKLFYKDWAVNHEFDAFGFVEWKYNLNFFEAMKKVYEDMIRLNPGNSSASNNKSYNKRNIIKIEKRDSSQITVKRRGFAHGDLLYWKQFGISLKTLVHYNVSAIERAWVNQKSVYLHQKQDVCYAYRFGDKKYKLYFPTRKEYRFLSTPVKIQGLNQLPEKGNILVITKSLKDVMTLHEFDIPAIALSSEAVVPDEELLCKLRLRFKNIVMFYDNDTRGILSMQKVKSELPCMWIPRKYNVKDISDYYKMYGSVATYKLINYAQQKFRLWKREKS